VYRPLSLIVPQFVPLQPLTLQLTAVFVVPVTVAVNCCTSEAARMAESGETTIEMLGGGGEI
jgi:hypothetical protein